MGKRDLNEMNALGKMIDTHIHTYAIGVVKYFLERSTLYKNFAK